MSACSSSAARHQCPVLPVAGESLPLRCPCISPSSPEACPVLQCALKGLQGNDCDSFVFSTLAGCYCVDRLKGAQATSGNLLSNVHDVQVHDDVCSVFMQSFLTASALSFLISASTPVLNALLLATQRRAVAWERGTSDDSAATRIMSTVFQAQVANTGLLMLLVFGRPPAASGATVPPLLRSLGVFNGPYDDFSRKWYGTVGAQLCASLVLAALTPHITRLL
eukprot:5260-Heterococcus_DN1.PRE.1